MKVVAALPPSPNLPMQEMQLKAVLQGHEVNVVTNPADLGHQTSDAEVLLASAFHPVAAGLIHSAGNLKFIQVPGVGVDHIDLAAAKAAGITVCNVAGANNQSVAEHVVMSALALVRGLVDAHNGMRAGGWPLPQWMAKARDIGGMTFGILGMGRIGREVAKRLLPFGVTILYTDPIALPPAEEDSLGATQVELGDLLAASDLITLHLPLTDGTRHLLNAERLHQMKQGAFLINTSRAEVVDEAALIEALKGHLGGAALDVFAQEPLGADSPLRQVPNVLLTPHGAGVTVDAQGRISLGAVQNLLRYMDKHPLADVVFQGSR
ncbi:MAG: 2-hydroxyacid dehydrogenase [Symbiobacteriia bacterium]